MHNACRTGTHLSHRAKGEGTYVRHVVVCYQETNTSPLQCPFPPAHALWLLACDELHVYLIRERKKERKKERETLWLTEIILGFGPVYKLDGYTSGWASLTLVCTHIQKSSQSSIKKKREFQLASVLPFDHASPRAASSSRSKSPTSTSTAINLDSSPNLLTVCWS